MENLEPIIIVCATDNFYAVLLSALIKSIEVNHKTDEKIHLYIIDDGISAKNIELLTQTVSSDVFTFFWHKAANVKPTDIVLPNDKSALPITAYLRLFAPYIVPKDAKKMLYLDVDMIVLKDISLLWNTDLGEYIFAAVQDKCKYVGSSWGGIKNFKELGLDPKTKYFNSGLMLLNPLKWREQNISSKVIKAVSDNVKWATFADQYGLNLVLLNQWLELDFRWNSYADLDYDDPYLVHYLNIKPIFSSYQSRPVYFDLFYTYLRLTPYKNFKVLSKYRLLFRKVVNKVNKMSSHVFVSKS